MVSIANNKECNSQVLRGKLSISYFSYFLLKIKENEIKESKRINFSFVCEQAPNSWSSFFFAV